MAEPKAEMHEALIPRGPVMKSENKHYVFHPYNVVLRHSVCPPVEILVAGEWKKITFKHGGGVGGDLPFERCARHLCKWVGYDNVMDYLQAMSIEFSIVGNQALRRFLSLNLGSDSALMMEYKSGNQ